MTADQELAPLEVTHRGFNGTRPLEFLNRWEVRDSRWDGIGRRDAPDAHLRTHDTHEAALADYEARVAAGLRPTLEQVSR